MTFLIIFPIVFILYISAVALTFIKKHHSKEYFVCVDNLIDYLNQNNKKRKINNINHNFTHKTANLDKNNAKSNNNIANHKFKKIHIYKKYIKYINKFKQPTYTEIQTIESTRKIAKILQNNEKTINKCNISYRSINKSIIIETIAISYANAILTKENFNVFSHFKKLIMCFKIYKKEARILNTLLIIHLSKIYLKLLSETIKIKNKIIRAKNAKKINTNNLYSIYGVYIFNAPAIRKIITNKNLIIASTTQTINHLDQILSKQKTIARYIEFLYSR